MDLAIIIAVTGTGIAMVGVMISMMFWMRGEANNLRAEAKADRKDMLNMIRAIESEVKDFHYKLLEIERKKT
jgi:hypothetical protein